MTENIKVSEVSEILGMQLESMDTGVQFDEVGTVLQVGDGVARIYGLNNAEANELIEFENGSKDMDRIEFLELAELVNLKRTEIIKWKIEFEKRINSMELIDLYYLKHKILYDAFFW